MATIRIDVEQIAVIYANMLEQAGRSDIFRISDKEVEHDIQDSAVSPAKTRLHLHTPVDDGTGASSSLACGPARQSEASFRSWASPFGSVRFPGDCYTARAGLFRLFS